MIRIDRNKTMTYFLPVFNEIVPIKHFHLLKNTYFWYDDITKDTFCLLFKFDGRIRGEHSQRIGFTVYEQELRDNPNYLGECDYGEYVLYLFELPEELIELKLILLRGKYSRISDEFKNLIISFIHEKYGAFDASVIQQVLNKDPEFRDNLSEQLGTTLPESAELSSIIDIDKEMFSNYVEYKNDINYENKTKKSWGWNPWAIANKS